MQAAYITQTGPAESIIVGELPTPALAPGQVLVRVHAAAVNPIDTYIRSGNVAMDLPSPYVVGCDLAGVVEQVGEFSERIHPHAPTFKPGDRVWGSNQGLLGRQGTCAEYAAVNEEWLYPTPDNVTDQMAAAGALVGITAYLGLVDKASLLPAETVFVNGGSGGVGSAVVQLAKAMGATVIATAGSQKKLDYCTRLGADLAINYNDPSLPEQLERLAPAGVSIWWEASREPNLERIVELLEPNGRAVIMAGRDARPELPVGPFYAKGCSLHGLIMFKSLPETQRAAADDLNRWLSSGAYVPTIAQVMPLSQTATAHRLQEDNTLGKADTLQGKIIIKMLDGSEEQVEQVEAAVPKPLA